jgi:transposase
VGQHGSASGSILLGLNGFEVTAAEVIDEEWRLVVQTTATTVGCAACGSQAPLHARRTVRVRDLPIGGRPVVLAWRKRIWRCREPACAVRTWTEQTVAIRPRAVLTERARAEACRRVGKDAHAVAAVARDLGVGWATVMRAVADHGRPLVDDPARLNGVAALGLDETSFLKATRVAPTRWATGLVTWSVAGCWTWWPTAPGPPWPAGSAPDPVTGWPRSSPPTDPAGHPGASGPQAGPAVPHP